MWLDLARYADSAGYGSDPLRTIWRYRDWVVSAFNRNLPYDQFTIEQLAGDLLPGATLDQKMATAFHRNTMTNTEGGTDDEEFRVAAIKDRVDTTMQVWMGMTMGLPSAIPTSTIRLRNDEYYRFYAIFNQTADTDQPDESPVISAPTAEITEQLSRVNARESPLKEKLDRMAASPALATAQTMWEARVSAGAARAAAGNEVPAEIRAIVAVPARRRTREQARKLADYFRSVAPELKPIRDEIARLEEGTARATDVARDGRTAQGKTARDQGAAKGKFPGPGRRGFSRRAKCVPSPSAGCSREPADAGEVAGRPGQSAHRARGGQSLLGPAFRNRNR